MNEQMQRLTEERQSICRQMEEVLEGAERENRNLTAEEDARYAGLERDLDAKGTELARLQRHSERSRQFAQPERETRMLPGGDRVAEPRQGAAVSEEEYRDAFARYLRSTRRGLDLTADQQRALESGFQVEQRAQAVGTGAAGGFVVPEGFYNQIQQARKQFGGVRRSRAFVLTTDAGNPLPVPTVDDTSNIGALLAENTAMAEQDVTFGQKVLGAYVYSSKIVRVSYQLLQDSAFDLEAFLGRVFGERLGRIESQHMTTGTGTGQPQGVVTASAVGKAGATGQTISVIYDDLIDLQHSVDPAYRMAAEWMLHDLSLKVIRKLKDGQQRPLWSPGIMGPTGALPDTILDSPYIVNNDMPQMAASAKSILYGDFSTYWIREVKGMTLIRLDERYADSLQVGFLAFSRLDAQSIDPSGGALKHYQNSAT